MPAPITRLVLVCALLLALPACGFFAPTVAVRRVGPDAVFDSLNGNALNSGHLSSATREVLQDYSLDELADEDPLEAVRRMHAVALVEPTRHNLFTLAELAYHAGRENGDLDAFLASAVYAWLYLHGEESGAPPSPYERRFRWACDIYNVGLQRAFPQVDGEYPPFRDMVRALPVGRLHVVLDDSMTPWDAGEYRGYIAGDDFLIRGLSLRLRDPGLGVPLVGVQHDGRPGPAPATAFLRVHGGLAQMQEGLDATVELHSGYEAESVQVGAHTVPIESDLSIMLAANLNESPLWKFSLAGLLEGNRAVDENRLIMFAPPRRGRIPVVFVHGTASNPAYWAEMFNAQLGDPELRSNMQFWFFQYASGNPILYSAMTLRRSLRAALDELDPDGTDEALRHVILVGHSQGGLLVRLLTSDGSIRWLEQALGKPVASLGLPPEQEALLREALEYRAFPEVTRAVYLATPHRGSFRAAAWYSRMIAKFIALPLAISDTLTDVFDKSAPDLPAMLGHRIPTALDNMDPSSPLMQRLAVTPTSPAVTSHSIVCIGDADPDDADELLDADDGVVKYVSAHIEPVASELLVASPHSCQDHPDVVLEVRRILREHLRDWRARAR